MFLTVIAPIHCNHLLLPLRVPACVCRANEYNDAVVVEDAPVESDMVDDAPEPEDEGNAAEPNGQQPAEQKVTTKFLTKYERGTQRQRHHRASSMLSRFT